MVFPTNNFNLYKKKYTYNIGITSNLKSNNSDFSICKATSWPGWLGINIGDFFK